MADQFLSTIQAASILGVSPRRVLALIKSGRLPSRPMFPDAEKSVHLILASDLDLVRDRPPGRPRLDKSTPNPNRRNGPGRKPAARKTKRKDSP